MPMQQALWLVSYDIADPRRLGRVARLMEKHGVRIQYSVFAVMATTAEIDGLRRSLEVLIKAREDDIRIYPISRTGRSMMLGASMLASDLLPHHPAFQQLRLPLSMKHTANGGRNAPESRGADKYWKRARKALIWTDEW